MGYKGSVTSRDFKKIWKQELVTNPHLFSIKIITRCDTRKKAYDREDQIQRTMRVISNPLYINKAYSSVRGGGAGWNKGLKLTDEIYKKGGRCNKGKVKGPLPETVKTKLRGPNPKKSNPGSKNGMFGKTHSDELKSSQAVVASTRFKGKSYDELYGTEKATELKKKRSTQLKGKNNAGKNNPRAKRILIVDPIGNEIECYGNLKDTCKELGLSFHLIYGALRSGKVSEHPKINGYSVRYLR
jgi:hypothetical protein